MAAPSYIEVLEKLKELGEATSSDIAQYFYSEEDTNWESMTSCVLGKLKRAAKYLDTVSKGTQGVKGGGREYIFKYEDNGRLST